METRTIDLIKQMSDKIKIRYLDVKPEDHPLGNVVADVFFPSLVKRRMRYIKDFNGFGKRTYAISTFIAKEMNITPIPFEDLAAMLGYRKKDLKEIIDAVKIKGYNLHLLGFGGTGTNFYHWLNEICIFTNTVNVFESITVWDDDKVDITNVFRFPFDLNVGSVHENSGQNGILKTSLAWNHIASTQRVQKIPSRIGSEELLEYDRESCIFYGAPDIPTRELFSSLEEKAKFVSGTHGDTECQLYINPPQNSDLQVESYGMINLSVFFMNQIKMTIEFLKLIGSEDDLITSREVMSYDFQKEYLAGNISKTGVSRTYNFITIENQVVNDSQGEQND